MMNKIDYTETVKLIQKMAGTSAFVYATVTAFQKDNRTIKAEIQPSGIETGWCRCLQGAFADKVGLEVLLGRIADGKTQNYIVLGILE
ncbi:MAG: hypothetical protein HFE58_14105 [Firmicutes bacterium]|jgi:hypothetical protein|nr:hypothetical protein [Bacillota bacterium]